MSATDSLTQPLNPGPGVTIRYDASAAAPAASSVSFEHYHKPSLYIVYFLAACLALDFAAVLVSMQAYWYLEHGNPNVYGFAFGSYDLTQLLFAPFFGWLATKGFRQAFLLACFINALGNVVYALGVVPSNIDPSNHSGWGMILGGRLISGVGSGAIAVGIVFITASVAEANRTSVMSTYRSSQSLARIAGPVAASFLLYLPFSPGYHSYLNGFTLPAYIATAATGILAPLALLCFFKEPPPAPRVKIPLSAMFNSRGPWVEIFGLILASFLFATTYWTYASNLFSIGFAQYGALKDFSDTWKIYAYMGVGFLGAQFVLKRLTEAQVSDLLIVMLGHVVLIFAFVFSLTYWIHGKPKAYYFFIAQAAVGVAGGLVFPSMLSHFSKRVTSLTQGTVSGKVGVIIGMFQSAGAAGRFLGPTIGGPLLRVHLGKECKFSLEGDFETKGCFLPYADGTYIALAGIMILTLIGFGLYTQRRLSTAENEVELGAHDSSQASAAPNV